MNQIPPEASSSRTPDLIRMESGGKITKPAEKLPVDNKGLSASVSVSAAHRGRGYKEKFQTLREKYDEVMATHERYERELAISREKIKSLQNECNLLLDAVDIAVPGQPTLMHYMMNDPLQDPARLAIEAQFPQVPGQAMPVTTAVSLDIPTSAPPPPHLNQRTRSGSTTLHTNGTNGHDLRQAR